MPGAAWHGRARLGEASQGKARPGKAITRQGLFFIKGSLKC